MKLLINKLNDTCKRGLESAAALCVSKTHYNIEIEHYLLRLLEQTQNDMAIILRAYEIDIQTIIKQVNAAVDRLPGGNQSTPALSKHILNFLEQTWMTSSLLFGDKKIRSGALLLTLIDQDPLRGIVLEICPLLLRISRIALRQDIHSLIAHSPENAMEDTPLEESPLPEPPAVDSPLPTLDRFTQDLTALARQGRIDPIVGRDGEIQQLIEILCRRQQNSPILVGDAGVGKTAIVEGLAQRIINQDVPPALAQTSLLRLDLTELQSGTGIRGELEDRLRRILQEVRCAPRPIILFVDEAHAFFGQASVGGGDAANLLKPALARGELQVIAATTWGEYKRHIEKDPALTRRLSLIKVAEPSIDVAQNMLRLMAPRLGAHHHVTILPQAVTAAAVLSHQYLPERKLPDKGISLLDTACSFVAMSQSVRPLELNTYHDELQLIDFEEQSIHQGAATRALSPSHQSRLEALAKRKEALLERTQTLHEAWQTQRTMHGHIAELEAKLAGANAAQDDTAQLKQQLSELEANWDAIAPIDKLIFPYVDKHAVAHVLTQWTGIPLATLLSRVDLHVSQTLFDKLKTRIIGQDYALEAITRQLTHYNNGLMEDDKPIGVFMLAGPSGVGKTQTALALAEVLSGHPQKLVQLNMNVFQEAHCVATLKGTAPGYAGYGKGGTLTEAVRRNPHGVILLDEFDRAHPDVLDIFYQIFDKGVLEDGEGLEVNFKNTLFILTTNAGTELIFERYNTLKETEDPALVYTQLQAKLTAHLSNVFSAPFMARMEVLPYTPLREQDVRAIINLKLCKLAHKVLHKHNLSITFDSTLSENLCHSVLANQTGVRVIDSLLSHEVIPKIIQAIATHGEAPDRPNVHIS